jgi:hypothetical protein
MLFKMDNTAVYTLSIPLLFSILFGYVHHFSRLYVSNTKMIIRQGDQIQFLLTRIIELDKKVKSLKSDIAIEKLDFLDDEELDCLEEEKEKSDCLDEEELDCLEEASQSLEEESQSLEEDSQCLEEKSQYLEEVSDCLEEKSQCLEKDFELVEPNSTYKITKNNGWLRFIF